MSDKRGKQCQKTYEELRYIVRIVSGGNIACVGIPRFTRPIGMTNKATAHIINENGGKFG